MAETVAFTATQFADGKERIELRRQREAGFLRKAKSELIPKAEWIRLAPPAGMAALSRLRSLPGAEAIAEDDDGLIVPPECIAPLTEHEAHSLGLPPATNLTLELDASGALHDGTISVAKKWLRRGGMPVRVKVTGARIRESSGTARLAEPIYSTNLQVDRLAAAGDGDERRARFAELREMLGDLDGDAVKPDGFISKVRIAYAANFSLDLRTHGGLFDFDPVLFSRSVGENEDGDLVDANETALLTDFEQQKFSTRFRSQRGGKRSYLLSDGTILFVDPLLGKALDIVREKQSATGDERKDFARSPQAYIRERLALDDTGDDEAADRLFIETQQYSERVAGIETWQKPVLPWIKPKPNSWLPESFGIRIGEEPDVVHVDLKPGEAEELLGKIDRAIDGGQKTTAFKGEDVPATPVSRTAVKSVVDLETEIANDTEKGSDNQELPAQLPTYFLKVGENFETLEYSRLTAQATDAVNFVPPPMPACVRSSPKPHQIEAFAWLTEAWDRKVPGLLLADDMGLGKTFQALTFLSWLRSIKAPGQPVLIVAPTGLLRNWQAEIKLHLEHGALGEIVEAFGTNLKSLRLEAGNDIRGGTSKLDVSHWKDAGVVLTTFETMRDYHMSFARVPFSAIIYDEIQKLKNPASQMTRAAKALNADIQVGMTGTPVENRLQDLWSIADVVFPGFLGSSKEFERTYSADDSDALKALQDQLIERDGVAPPFMLRRMKEALLTGLPSKEVVPYEVSMPLEQADAYDRVLARARALRQSGDKGAMLKILHMLRGTSLHPKPPVGLDDFEGYISSSARLAKTFELLDEISRKGEKALVFCEDLDMQAFLAIAFQERFGLSHAVQIINGSVAGSKRQDMVTKFQSRPAGFDVMILSPKAGGVGLTITAANHVIHLSRWWNPAVEDQATDRVYRIGQDKPVTVHIPMAVHPDDAIGPSSFDVRLNRLMERKRELSRGLLVPPESASDIDEMLSAVLDGEKPTPTKHESAGEPAASQTSEPPDPASIDMPESDRGAPFNEGSASDELTPAPTHVVSTSEEGIAAQSSTQSDSDDEAVADDGESISSARSEAPPTRQDRPILSAKPVAKSAIQSPVEAAESRVTEVRRVVYEVGGMRDWTIFNQHIEGCSIQSLRIIDPYCCANEAARRRLVDFVVRFAKASRGVTHVQVKSFDADSVKDCWESDDEQSRDLQSRMAGKLPDAEFRHIQKSRRSAEDLHDRSVTALLENGEKVIWDLGRGIDGVMTARNACTVNAFREPALDTAA
ncbi:DEAD/DEAH box helicase [Aurantiacibacter poecillastricola]|uniref:DEAD/DEAH box helicase n=1 Tax=Aurantiacibacter poecillastricola TaxID=3064385 RepID=UPI00273FF41F|nr:DEAD/DEAH box helicase [Aurantiacibacter sp. 219JJ12-13]MDP5263297.1 DEAD/DEAH box helicase [Aurantiacibacter sp. 219JJ12-13]